MIEYGPGPFHALIACASCPTALMSEMYDPVTVVVSGPQGPYPVVVRQGALVGAGDEVRATLPDSVLAVVVIKWLFMLAVVAALLWVILFFVRRTA